MAREEVDNCPAQPHINIKQWYKYKNLRTLNILLAVPLMTSFTLGFDSSMFGALQASDAWQHYFNYPVGSTLASLGAAPIIAAFPAIVIIPLPRIVLEGDGVCSSGACSSSSAVLFKLPL